MRLILTVLMAACLWMAEVAPAHAYIGPALGAGTLGAILGFIVSILLAIFAVLWYPIKRIMKKMRSKKEAGRSRDAD